MKPWKIWKFIINHILILLVIDGIIVFFGGLIYFSEIANVLVRVGMSLQNVFESLLFNPFLSINDLLFNTNWESLSVFKYISLVIYALAMIITPLLDLLIVFRIVDHFMHLTALHCRKDDKRVLVIGNGNDVIHILKKDVSGFKVFFWTLETIPAELKSELYEKRIAVYQAINPFSLNLEDIELAKDSIDRFINKKKIEDVILLMESDVQNMQYYMLLSSLPVCEKRTIHFYMSCYDIDVKRMTEDYFNNIVEEKDNMDLRIFNVLQIQAISLLQEYPIYQCMEDSNKMLSSEPQMVHILLHGGGSFGEELIVQTFNQAVISSDNEILLDVIDQDINNLKGRIEKRFHCDSYTFDNKEDGSFEYIINQKCADGLLRIRLFNADVRTDKYTQCINNIKEDEITYVIVTIPDPELNIHCLMKLNQLLFKKNHKIPIVLRVSNSKEFENYISTAMSGIFASPYLIGNGKDLVSIKEIINNEVEEKIRNYDAKYQLINGNLIDYTPRTASDSTGIDSKQKKSIDEIISGVIMGSTDRDLKWNKRMYYKREQNRALYYHSSVKEKIWEGENLLNEIRDLLEASDGYTDYELSKELIRRSEENSDEYAHMKLLKWAKMEHRRWCLALVSEGWSYNAEATNKSGRREKNREHNCLCNWDILSASQDTNSTLVYDLLSCPGFMEKV